MHCLDCKKEIKAGEWWIIVKRKNFNCLDCSQKRLQILNNKKHPIHKYFERTKELQSHSYARIKTFLNSKTLKEIRIIK